MRAVVCKEFGPPEGLVVEDLDDPRPGAGELLVKVAASAVTFPDTLMLADKYQFKATPPYIPGGEVAGVIAEIGEGVEGSARRVDTRSWPQCRRGRRAGSPTRSTSP